MKTSKLLAMFGLCSLKYRDKEVEALGRRIITETLWLRRVIESKSREIAELRRQIQPRNRLGRYIPKGRGAPADQIRATVEKTAEDFIREMRPRLQVSPSARPLPDRT